MVKYKTPAYYHILIDWAKIDESVAMEYQRQYDEALAENKEIQTQLSLKLKQAKISVKDIFGESSREAKYMSKKSVQGFYMGDKPMDKWKKLHDERVSKEESDRRKRENDSLLQQKTQRAVIWLQARGKILGTDFTIVNAYNIANQIAFDEAIAERKGTFMSFSGDDSCENCQGYDGTSNRCDCGHRRVSYSMVDGSDFEEPSIIAEAY